LKAISLTLFLLAAVAARGNTSFSAKQVRRMVVSELNSQGSKGDSVWMPLLVTDLTNSKADFYLTPVTHGDSLVAVYRDDPRRSWVREVAPAMTLRLLRRDLLTVAGAARFFRTRDHNLGRPLLVSVGPLSLFGALGAGWFIPIGNSYLLLSCAGDIADAKEVAKLWPNKSALLNALLSRGSKLPQGVQDSTADR
jgi:hypothetical protein